MTGCRTPGTWSSLRRSCRSSYSFRLRRILDLRQRNLSEVEFGGSVLRVDKVKTQELIFITPEGKRIKAFEELQKPQHKKDCQIFSGMLSSLSKWSPTVAMEIPLIRKATASKGKFIWINEMEKEYEVVRKIVFEQIQLTPFDLNKSLRLVIESAGFVLFKFVDEMNPGDGVVIVGANCTRFKESKTLFLSYRA